MDSGNHSGKVLTKVCFIISIIFWSVFALALIVPLQRPKELKLSFKSLYVLSSKIANSSFTELPDVLLGTLRNETNIDSNISKRTAKNAAYDYGGISSLQNSKNDGAESQGLCVSSGRDTGMLKCVKLLPSRDNIFFLETSCAANQASVVPEYATLPLSEKQACSIYSAAIRNPTRKVILLFTCPIPEANHWTKQWKILFGLPNFFFGWVDLEDLYSNTSLAEFYHGPLAGSNWPVSHQSDLFRLFILYLYGGTYMDLDVITFKSLDGLGFNFVINQGFKTEMTTANSGWNFESNHQFLEQCMFEAINHYAPSVHTSLGPQLLTDTLNRFCYIPGDDPNSERQATFCNLRVLPQNTFFSVDYRDWEDFYNASRWSHVKHLTRDSYGVHYWNHMGNRTLHVGSDQPIVKFAEQHCPPIYYNAGGVLS